MCLCESRCMFVFCMRVCVCSVRETALGIKKIVELPVHTVATGGYCAHAGLVKLHSNPFKSIMKGISFMKYEMGLLFFFLHCLVQENNTIPLECNS